jgi:hypothetical protein
MDCIGFKLTNTNSTEKIAEYITCCYGAPQFTTAILPPYSSMVFYGDVPDVEYLPAGVNFELMESITSCMDVNLYYQYNYRLINCTNDQVVYSNYLECPQCYLYINQQVYTNISESLPCWYVTVIEESVTPVSVNIDIDLSCDPCTPKCFVVTGTGNITYIDTDDQLSIVTAPNYICSQTYPFVVGENNQIFDLNEECSGYRDCPGTSRWFVLTNYETEQVINSDNIDLIYPALLDQTVKLEEYPGCWYVEIGIGDTPFTVPVSVIETFDSLIECDPPINYKLESCGESEPLTIYTNQDLSAYNGKTVKINEYPGCFNVTVFIDIYPDPVTVTITNQYDDCPACESPRYLLTDCDGIRSSIYTTTNLSAYLTSVIKLTFYPDTCWTVEETLINTSDDLVIVGNQYSTCLECSADSACLCTSITNNSDNVESFSYRDCDNLVNTITLNPGETSSKYCVLKWIYPSEWTLPKIINNCGECVDGKCEVIKPIRSIRPGYNTPSCSIQYYEKITCEFSEILYKNVISERYGIAPCCPEEEVIRLDIKYQLLEMQAINNPDYVCTTVNCSCNQTTSCGCGCNS